MKRRSFFKSLAAAVSLPFVAKAAQALPEPMSIRMMPKDSPLRYDGTNLKATKLDGNMVLLSWQAPEPNLGIDHYEVRVGEHVVSKVRGTHVMLGGKLGVDGKLSVRAVEYDGRVGAPTTPLYVERY